jgi:TolB-like protein
MKLLMAILACVSYSVIACAEEGRARPVVVVLPFRMIGSDASRNWIADAVRENVQSDLLGHEAATLVAPVPGKAGQHPAPPDGPAAALDAGRAAKADLAIFGAAQVNDVDVRVTGQVIDLSTGKAIGAFKASGTLRHLFEVEDQLTEQILGLLGVTPPDDEHVATPDPGVAAVPEMSRQVGPEYSPLDDEAAWAPVYSYPSYAWDPDAFAYTPAYVSWYPCYAFVPTFFALSFSEDHFLHHHHDHHDGGHRPHFVSQPGHSGNHGHATVPVVRPRPVQQGGGRMVVSDPSHWPAHTSLVTAGMFNPVGPYLDPVSQAPKGSFFSSGPRRTRPVAAAAAVSVQRPGVSFITINRAGRITSGSGSTGDGLAHAQWSGNDGGTSRSGTISRRSVSERGQREVPGEPSGAPGRITTGARRGRSIESSSDSRDVVISSPDSSPSRGGRARLAPSSDRSSDSAGVGFRTADPMREAPAPSASAEHSRSAPPARVIEPSRTSPSLSRSSPSSTSGPPSRGRR